MQPSLLASENRGRPPRSSRSGPATRAYRAGPPAFLARGVEASLGAASALLVPPGSRRNQQAFCSSAGDSQQSELIRGWYPPTPVYGMLWMSSCPIPANSDSSINGFRFHAHPWRLCFRLSLVDGRGRHLRRLGRSASAARKGPRPGTRTRNRVVPSATR